MSVFEYGCENEGLKNIKSPRSSFTKARLIQRLLTTRKSRAKQRFYYPNKKIENYEVTTGRNTKIFLIRVCERV